MTQKTILLATLGKHPQIITETLYAIHQEGLDWPDEINIITNRVCKEMAINTLLNCPTTQKAGKIQELCNYLNRPAPLFNLESFFTISDHNSFDDFISVENEIENFIMEGVRVLTEDTEQQIHAVYTGGIKTMSTILCRAMDFYGRPFDRLSSIFVSDEFQRCDNFYYPKDQVIDVGDGTLLNAKDATITLRTTRPLPHIDKLKLKENSAFNIFSYAELIKFLEYSAEPEKINIELVQNNINPCIKVFWNEVHLKTIPFGKGDRFGLFCFYAMITESYKNGKNVLRPKQITGKHSKKDKDAALASSKEIFKLFVNKIREIDGSESFMECLKDSSLDSLKDESFHAGAFDTHLTNVKSHIKRYIPPYFSIFFEPSTLKSKPGYRLYIPEGNIRITQE